jgi:hypothetical protein
MCVDRRAILPAKKILPSSADRFEPALGMSRDIARTKTRRTNLPRMDPMHQKYGFLILLPILVACATNTSMAPGGDGPNFQSIGNPNSYVQVSRGITVKRNGDTVIYRGRLTEEGLKVVRKAGLGPPVTTLLIDSSGGEIVVGMKFGVWVLERNLDIVVDRACLSSCANYVFTAARNKEIQPGAVVAWHGSAKQPGLLEQLHKAEEKQIDAKGLSRRKRSKEIGRARQAHIEYLTAAIQKQNAFFYRVGVDEYITRIGNDKYGVRGFFYLSVDDMASFGLNNVTATKGYTNMEPRALARRVGFPVSLVTLE